VNRDLPDLFGLTSNISKAIFGAIVVGGYYLAGGFSGTRAVPALQPEGLSAHEPAAVFHHDVFLAHHGGPAAQDAVAAWFNIKYVWITPWFNV
jgi:hypothetical protein